MAYLYTVYGLTAQSNIPIWLLPEHTPATANRKIDLSLHFQQGNIRRCSGGESIAICPVCNDCYEIRIPGIATYQVSLSEISCIAPDENAFLSTLWNLPFSVWFLLHGELLIHACAVVANNSLILLMGSKGAGKSTLSFLLDHHAFLPFFADDTVRLDCASSGYRAHGYAKLFPSILTKIGGDSTGSLNLAGKLYTPCSFSDAAVLPVRAAVFLKRGAAFSFEASKFSQATMWRQNIVGLTYLPPALLRQVMALPMPPHSIYRMTLPNDFQQTVRLLPEIKKKFLSIACSEP